MTNRYQSVGFAVESAAAVDELLRRAMAEGVVEALLDGGRLVRWHDAPSGARLAVLVRPDGAVRSATPSFRPDTPQVLSARLTGLLPDGADADADAVQLAPRHASYPLAVQFETGGLAINDLPFGDEVDLELVGFAHAMECYPHEDAYRSSGIPLRIREVLPAGLVPLAGAEGPCRSRATALVSGVVLACTPHRNVCGGGEFLHVVIDTEAMVLDAVVCPQSVEGPPVQPGRIVTASMWFVARRSCAVLDPSRPDGANHPPAAPQSVRSAVRRALRSRRSGRPG